MDAEGAAQLIAATTPDPAWWVVVATGLFAVGVSASAVRPSALTQFNVLGTLVHEFGHAAAGVVAGGSANRLQISAPDAGVTHTSTAPGFAACLMWVSGYAAPPLAGLGAAHLLEHGHAPAVLALLAAVTMLVLPISRGGITLASVVGIGAVALGVLWFGADRLQAAVAYAVAWMLLCSGVMSLLPLVRVRWFGRVGGDDAACLHRATGVPGFVWILGWFALALWCLWTGIPLLWP